MTHLYHFRCPSCLQTDADVGPAKELETICGVCWTQGVRVKLERRVMADGGQVEHKSR